MPSKKKKELAEQAFLERQHERMIHTEQGPSLGEQFPTLKEININLTTVLYDTGGWDEKNFYSSPIKYIPKNRPTFEYKCPNPNCKMGSFDLSAIVHNSLSQNDTPRTGNLRCAGRDRDIQCGVCLSYKISFQY